MLPLKNQGKGSGKEARRQKNAKDAARKQRKRASLAQASRGGAGGAGSDTGDAGASPWQHTSALPGAGRRGDDCKLGWLLQIWSSPVFGRSLDPDLLTPFPLYRLGREATP